MVLRCVKNLHARARDAYRAENVVARVFIGRQDDPLPQIRDHSNIARAYAAWGKAGVEEVNALVLPHEPGSLRGLAPRCGRALHQLKRLGVWGVDAALEQGQTIRVSVKEHHLFATGQAAKRQVLVRL